MEPLLYDYHLAQSLAKLKKDSADYYTRIYTESVFRKYGVTEAKFNHSMEWYTRNSEELFQIYKKIDKRFAEVRSSTKIHGNRYATMTEEGDTMNIWKGKSFYLLTNDGNNKLKFTQDADSTFEEGDRLMWQFDTQWYYREGVKGATALLALVYENDSVSSNLQSVYSTGKQDIYVTVGEKPLKSIMGLVYQDASWSEQPKIMVISDPVLVRFKKAKPKKVEEIDEKLSQDSLALKTSYQPISNDSLKAIQDSLHDERVAVDEKKTEANPGNQRILHLPR